MSFIDCDNFPKDANRNERQSLQLNSLVTQQLRQLSLDENTTLGITLLAALQALLKRYTDSPNMHLMLSSTTGENAVPGHANEFAPDALIEHTVLIGDTTFQNLLQRTNAALKHKVIPSADLFVAVRTDLGIINSQPIRILFEFRPDSCGTTKLPDLKIRNVDIDEGFTKSNIRLGVAERTLGVTCLFEYDDDLCDVRMASHFQNLLQGISDDRQQTISMLPLLTPSERQQLVVDWNATSTELAEELFRHQLFESQVDKSPAALAVICADEHSRDANRERAGPIGNNQGFRTLTYSDLDMRANQLANYLIQLGVGPDVPVGLCMEASAELVVAVLAISKGAGACVPFDPSFPGDQLAYMAHDANVAVILTQQVLLEKVPLGNQPIVCLDADWDRLISQQSSQRPVNRLLNGNLAFVFYTSGSTGRPKAVMLTHRRSDPRSATSECNADDRHLLKASIGFTPLQMEVFLPLTSGGRIIVAPPEARRDSARLVQLIVQHQITVMNLVPSMLRQLLNEPDLDRCQCLQNVVCFGEPLPTELRELFFAHFDATLNVHYGTTEAPSATTLTLTRTDVRQTNTIGRRNENRRIFVLDAHQQPVPIGIAGELYVGGYLSRGYLNNPHLTAERFVPNPYPHSHGERLYRTGDRVRCLSDGNLQFLGRIDHQVKIRGFRVELGEVEAILGQHADVDSAIAIIRKDKVGGNQLVAYAACAGRVAPEVIELRRFVESKLPSHMVPAQFVILKSMPLGLNGKVDRRALPEPDQSLRTAAASLVAPRNETEEKLAEIWREVFGVPRIGVYDNFFELGGDSLLAMQLVTRMANVLGIKVRPSAPFESPTIAELATRIASLRGSGTDS